MHRYVCLSVCLPPKALINSGVIWFDISHVCLVQLILQLFRILPSINWKGLALVTQHVMHARQRCRSWCCTGHRRRHINYSAAATTRNASVIKVSGQMHSDEFNRIASLQLNSNNLELSTTIKNMHCYAFPSDESLFTWLPLMSLYIFNYNGS